MGAERFDEDIEKEMKKGPERISQGVFGYV